MINNNLKTITDSRGSITVIENYNLNLNKFKIVNIASNKNINNIINLLSESDTHVICFNGTFKCKLKGVKNYIENLILNESEACFIPIKEIEFIEIYEDLKFQILLVK